MINGPSLFSPAAYVTGNRFVPHACFRFGSLHNGIRILPLPPPPRHTHRWAPREQAALQHGVLLSSSIAQPRPSLATCSPPTCPTDELEQTLSSSKIFPAVDPYWVVRGKTVSIFFPAHKLQHSRCVPIICSDLTEEGEKITNTQRRQNCLKIRPEVPSRAGGTQGQLRACFNLRVQKWCFFIPYDEASDKPSICL